MDCQDSSLTAKAADFIFVASSKQKVDYSQTALRPLFEGLVDALVCAVSITRDQQTVDALRALSAVLFENAPCLPPKVIETLLASLLSSADRTNPNTDMRRMSINCLGNLCTKAGKVLTPTQLDAAFKILADNLSVTPRLGTDPQAEKRVASSTYRALQFVIQERKTLTQNQVVPLLRDTKTFLFPEKRSGPDPPQTPNSQPSSPDKGRGRAQRARRAAYSDSDLSNDSDIGSGGGASQHHSTEMKAKQNALACLQSAVKAGHKHTFGCWSDFIPDSPLPRPSLFSIMKDSPAPKLRSAAAAAFSAMIDGSKQYLAMADDSGVTGTFLSLSQKVGNFVIVIHSELYATLATETDPSNISQLVKVFGILAANCPYGRLKKRYLTPFVELLVSKLHHAELAIRTASLTSLTAVFSITPPLPELREGLAGSFGVVAAPDKSFVALLWSLSATSQPAQIRCGALECLSAATLHYGAESLTPGQVLANCSPCCGDREAVVRVAACKLLGDYVKFFRDRGRDQDAAHLMLRLFEDGVVASAAKDSHPAMRVAVLDLVSLLSDAVLKELPTAVASHLLDLPFILLNDDTPLARLAAAKTLGILSFLAVNQGTTFVRRSCKELRPLMLADSNANVRTWASWSLANVCDLLVVTTRRESVAESAFAEEGLFAALAALVLDASAQGDKLAVNCVRCAGDLLRCTLAGVEDSTVRQLILLIERSLASEIPKVKWNACHATGNALRNRALQSHPAWAFVFSKLTGALSEIPLNFKVRMNALSALLAPFDQPDPSLSPNTTASFFSVVLESLRQLGGLENIGFAEAKYHDQYEHQLQEAVLQLLCHLSPTSAVSLKGSLADLPYFLDLLEKIKPRPPEPRPVKPANLPIRSGPDPATGQTEADDTGRESSGPPLAILVHLAASQLLELVTSLSLGDAESAQRLRSFLTNTETRGEE